MAITTGTATAPVAVAGDPALPSWRTRVAGWIPEGGTLPDDVWESRHRTVVRLGYAAAIALTLVPVLQGDHRLAELTGGLWVLLPCWAAQRALRSRTARSSAASLALLVAVAISIADVHGRAEAHFGFFVVVGLLTLYQERIPFLLSIAFVVLHHGILGTLQPGLVFDSARCADSPWLWGAIHGTYVLAASAVFVTAWRLNEEYRLDAARADARLLSSERRFRGLVRGSQDLKLLCDRDGTVRWASPASRRILGIDDADLVGHPLRGLVDPEDWPRLRDRLAGVAPYDGTGGTPPVTDEDHQVVAADGSRRRVHVNFSDQYDDPDVAGMVLHMRDVTDRRRLEAELRHAQKLESIGQLAAGIAHEINTPIQYIGDNLRFVMDSYEQLERLFALVRAHVDEDALAEVAALEDEIDVDYLRAELPLAFQQTAEGVDRVATIVRAMKAFGHPGSRVRSAADVNEAVRNTLAVTGNVTKHVATVATELGEVPPVWSYPGDLNQVLVNLVVNAAHAVADRAAGSGPGAITVRTRLDGEDVVVEVEDNGAGIAPEVADRVFEPFFTTKEVGRGTGQGLALCYTLVHDRHGGDLTFTSTPGEGTTFVVRLPPGPAS